MEREESRTDTQIRIRKAGYDDVDALKKVLAKTFDEDPIHKWCIAQDRKRTARMEKHFETHVKHYAMKYDHVFTTEELDVVAVWFPPEPKDSWKSSTLKDLSLIHKWVAITGFWKLLTTMSAIEFVKKRHLKRPHYYLSYIGVDPPFQGRGIGTDLLWHGLQMCRQRGLPAYLETSQERNVRYYERNGFTVSEEFFVPHDGPKIWTMIYEPK